MNNNQWKRIDVGGIEVDGLYKLFADETYGVVELLPDGTWQISTHDRIRRYLKQSGFERASEACAAGDAWWAECEEKQEVIQYE